jgi:quaternary ammonium compound-resistance protein SugE
MAWPILIVAGLLEVVWALSLKYTHGFSRPLATAGTIAAIIASTWLLSVAAKSLPIGTAYGVWVGIGAVGAAIGGMVLFGEPATLARLGLLAMLVASIVGLKLTSP